MAKFAMDNKDWQPELAQTRDELVEEIYRPVRTFLEHKDYTTAIDINPHYITPKMFQFRLLHEHRHHTHALRSPASEAQARNELEGIRGPLLYSVTDPFEGRGGESFTFSRLIAPFRPRCRRYGRTPRRPSSPYRRDS